MKKLFMISNLLVSLLVVTLSGCTTIPPDSIIYSPNPITNFAWVGMDADKVGRFGPDEGRPNGEKDGHFRLNLNFDQPTEIIYIALYLSSPYGVPIGGVVWHTYPPEWWVLGVFHQSKQLNFNHVTSLGKFSGPNEFDLYANDSGQFREGNYFFIEVKLGDGRAFKRILQLKKEDIAAEQYGKLYDVKNFGSNISTDLNDGLVAYYLFNGNANDESGNGNHGTVYGATLTSDRFGNPNSAYAFDGIDDGIFVSNSFSLSFSNFLRGYSISAWIKPSQKSNAASDYSSDIVSKNFAVFSMRLNNVRSRVESTQCLTDGSCAMQNPFSIVFDSNRWYHVVTTWEGNTGNWTVYFDGLAGPTSSLSDLRPYRKTGEIDGPITIGRDGWYDRWFFKGAIDDIRIYNRALSKSEVQQLHIAPDELRTPLKLQTYSSSKKFFLKKTIIEQKPDHVTAEVSLMSGAGCWYIVTPNFNQAGTPVSKTDVYYLAPNGTILVDSALRFEPGQYYQLDIDRWNNVGSHMLVALDVILRAIFSRRLEDVMTKDRDQIGIFIDVVKGSRFVSGLDTGTGYLSNGEYLKALREYLKGMKELADEIGHDRMEKLFTSVVGQSGKVIWNSGIESLLEVARLPDKYYLLKEIIDNYATNPEPLNGYVRLTAQ